MVQSDAERPFSISEVPEGVLHLHLVSLRCREEVVPHCQGRRVLEDHVRVLEPHRSPTLDGEPGILGADAIGGHEVRESGLEGASELVVGCHRRFEQDLRVVVGIERVDVSTGAFDVGSAAQMSRRDLHDALAPCTLRSFDLLECDHDMSAVETIYQPYDGSSDTRSEWVTSRTPIGLGAMWVLLARVLDVFHPIQQPVHPMVGP